MRGPGAIVGVWPVQYTSSGLRSQPLFFPDGATHAPVPASPADGRGAMNSSRLLHYINDPRGPEEVLPTLPTEELANLLDALFRNLDTPEPEYGAQAWYEMAVEESTRRSAVSEGAAHGVA